MGAGPAGLECAIVLGKRGFERVHLVDADDDIGGCMRWVTQMPGLGGVGPRDRLPAGAARPAGQRVGRALVTADGAACAGVRRADRDRRHRVALGGRRPSGVTRRPIPGADATLPHVLTPEQVMLEGKRPPGKRVAVVDYEGYFTGTALAELLRGEGYEVEFVTSHESVAPIADQTLEGLPVRRRLHAARHRRPPGRGGGSRRRRRHRPGRRVRRALEVEVDAVVLVTQRVSDDSLYRELVADPEALEREGVEAVYRIGDCVAPR